MMEEVALFLLMNGLVGVEHTDMIIYKIEKEDKILQFTLFKHRDCIEYSHGHRKWMVTNRIPCWNNPELAVGILGKFIAEYTEE